MEIIMGIERRGIILREENSIKKLIGGVEG